MDPGKLHELIKASFSGRDNAYAPYSNFRVGAALLMSSGEVVTGCNVENASYGAGLCAERTAIAKAVSTGHKRVVACVVTSDVPAPTTSPCGICRQVLREFMPLDGDVYMVAAGYPVDGQAPAWLGQGGDEEKRWICRMTLDQLLPMSFGPDNLARAKGQ